MMILDWIKQTNEGMQLLGMNKPAGQRWMNCYDFVQNRGMAFVPPTEPFPYLMEPKNCYGNSTNLVLMNEERYIYCEGYAWCMFLPIAHAWVWDTWEQVVVDPTLQEPAPEYFGLVFDTGFLKRRLVENEVYGMIDTPWDGFALLGDPEPDWQHKSFTAA